MNIRHFVSLVFAASLMGCGDNLGDLETGSGQGGSTELTGIGGSAGQASTGGNSMGGQVGNNAEAGVTCKLGASCTVGSCAVDGIEYECLCGAFLPASLKYEIKCKAETDAGVDAEAGQAGSSQDDPQPAANPCDDNPCPQGYCENHGGIAVCSQVPPQGDAGSAQPANPCIGASCEIATHCEPNGLGAAYCVVDAAPTAIECELPPEPMDGKTASIISKQRFMLPDEAVPNNNNWVGPFCCTGHTAVVTDANANPMAYAYYYGWESEAYIIGDTSYTSDVTIFVAGRGDPKNNPQSTFFHNAIHFTTEELASCISRTVWAGAFRATATPRHSDVWRPYCLGGELGFDMGTLTFVIDFKYGYND